jgi:hypothetical protein
LRIPIADETRQEVITKWLSGYARDKIAGEIGVGAGTVTNIIAKWTDEVGTPTAAALRELSVEIRRAGMSIRECARGLRITRVLSSKLADDEVIRLQLFVDKIYNKCKYLNISPDHLVELAREIWELSKNMPASHIPSYLEEKMNEKGRLETEITKLNAEISLLTMDYNRIVHISKTTIEALEEYNEVRGYLSEYGLGPADLHKLMLTLQNLKKYNFDASPFIQKISRNQTLEFEEQELQKTLAKEREELKVIKNTSIILENDMDEYAKKIEYCNDLRSLGYGLDELRSLKNAIFEIAGAKNGSSSTGDSSDVVKLFFERIEEFRNLESSIESLKKEKNGIEESRNMLVNEMRDFIGQTKKDIKQVSDVAIEVIKMAQEDRGHTGLPNNNKDIT